MHILYRWGRHDAVYAREPKRVIFTLHTGAPWDDDAWPAGVKPMRDALVDMHIVHSDAPESGHTFTYRQMVHRGKGATAKRGIEIYMESAG